ncbi:hypothetical protein DFQ28_000436 [Apophysomyces sp. BC1034]|nr:hypothetical protein DFQ30_000441 [Apophysomyces sp. BC1015]KAG0178081.1 hypothetical protein DFQ29_003959 [Apophysomyces sp. BC1021]KAG0191319.1 hypothetical protein DFQ28_000436 [Apophysomyces sp. BC1034]
MSDSQETDYTILEQQSEAVERQETDGSLQISANETLKETSETKEQATENVNWSEALLAESENKRKRVFRWMEGKGQTESDKDLMINSLAESLQIHKEIVERIQREKDVYEETMEKRHAEERNAVNVEREKAQLALEEHKEHYARLEAAYQSVVQELEAKKQEYKRIEANFYSHVRTIKPTDDDLSTIQPEIGHLFSQLNNLCMSLRSKIDREAATTFVQERWPALNESVKELMKNDEKTLDSGYITLFAEKFLVETMLHEIMKQPIHLGVSVNEAFEQVDAWIRVRNEEWATRLRQQISALVVKQPADEQESIEKAKEALVERIIDQLSRIYPTVKEDANQAKKILNIVNRTAKLNLAMKGQEILVKPVPIEEGVATFNSTMMKPVNKGKPEGRVLIVISPPFIASDPNDPEHGFVILGKVLCA